MTLPLIIETPAVALGASAGDTSTVTATGDNGAGQDIRGEADVRPALEIHVVGIPAPQGSKRGFVVGNRAVIVDDNKPKLRSWREDVKHAALDALWHWHLTMQNPSNPSDPTRQWQPLTDCTIEITFLMPRPKSHYRNGRYANVLRDDAPTRHTTKPDGDKLVRSTLDALGAAGIYRDDSNVADHTGRKRYANDRTGAVIRIYTTTGR